MFIGQAQLGQALHSTLRTAVHCMKSCLLPGLDGIGLGDASERAIIWGRWGRLPHMCQALARPVQDRIQQNPRLCCPGLDPQNKRVVVLHGLASAIPIGCI